MTLSRPCFAISSDRTFHVLSVRHMMHMRIPSIHHVYNYTITLSLCVQISLLQPSRVLCAHISHNTFTVFLIIKFLVVHLQKDLTLYVDKNGTVENLLQEAANEVNVISTQNVWTFLQIKCSLMLTTISSNEYQVEQAIFCIVKKPCKFYTYVMLSTT